MGSRFGWCYELLSLNLLRQSLTEVAPPKPQFTEFNLPDLAGKIYVVTGATNGVGRELAKILYLRNAIVYVGSRSDARFYQTAVYIKTNAPSDCTGELRLLKMDLSDLPTVKNVAEKLLSEVKRIDTIWYNAGVMGHPTLNTTVQGFELHWGTNVVGHFLLNKLLTPLLAESARSASVKGSVRAIWVASDATLFAPSQGINWEDVNFSKGALQMTKYAQSKAAAVILAYELSKREADSGLVSLSLNPGHLITGMQENRPKWLQKLGNLVSYHPKYGAYTEIFAAFAELNPELQSGGYVIPWGRFGSPRGDIVDGYTNKGTGTRLWDLLDAQIVGQA
ncbi:hypothetical protein V1512DRAFT_262097 [Lipomyces arxii]|uniref:uncharacterized protein n=1 Tax=Lipomyces arxii TaxID=56418 RepID=UPI0034CDC312